MITNLLKAGFPTVLLQTFEPHRTEEELRTIPGWQISRWDCLQGIRGFSPQSFHYEEIQNPVEAISWLTSTKDTLSLGHILPIERNK